MTYSKFYQHTRYFMCRENITTLQLRPVETSLPIAVPVMHTLLMKSGFPKSSTIAPHLAINLTQKKKIH
jgi:hypothetical protein